MKKAISPGILIGILCCFWILVFPSYFSDPQTMHTELLREAG